MLSSPFRAHTDLGGKPWENREDAKRLAERMNHVEAVRLCDPNYDVRRISVRRRFPRELARPSLLGFHTVASYYRIVASPRDRKTQRRLKT